MKGSENFTKVIQAHLNSLAAADDLFAVNLNKPNKNITECIAYIFQEVKKTGQNGFDDAEIFKMAIHYYDEDSITVTDTKHSGSVVSNHHIPADKKSAKDMGYKKPETIAKEKSIKDKLAAAKPVKGEKAPAPAKAPVTKKVVNTDQISLF